MSFKQKISKASGMPANVLPGSYQIIGNVLLLKLMKIKSLKEKKKVASAIMGMMPYIRTVCEISGVEKELRLPEIKKLAGSETITVHKEHGILYKLDVAKIMFSKGNLNERQRLIKLVNKNETITDMFAGIGYFSLGLAKFSGARKIIAIEKNPVAFDYLKENIGLNKIKNISPVLGDNRKISGMERKADRVIMGYFPKTDEFLPYALAMLKDKGVIHFHNAYKEDDLWKKPLKEIEKACAGFSYKILMKKKVKSIAPRTWHVVMDVEVRK